MFQKEQLRVDEYHARSSRERALEERVEQMERATERMTMERDDAVTKFEESARASGALLQQVHEVEHSNDSLRREIEDLKEVRF